MNLNGKLRKKLGGPKRGSSKNLGWPWPTQAPLRIAAALDTHKLNWNIVVTIYMVLSSRCKYIFAISFAVSLASETISELRISSPNQIVGLTSDAPVMIFGARHYDVIHLMYENEHLPLVAQIITRKMKPVSPFLRNGAGNDLRSQVCSLQGIYRFVFRMTGMRRWYLTAVTSGDLALTISSFRIFRKVFNTRK